MDHNSLKFISDTNACPEMLHPYISLTVSCTTSGKMIDGVRGIMNYGCQKLGGSSV